MCLAEMENNPKVIMTDIDGNRVERPLKSDIPRRLEDRVEDLEQRLEHVEEMLANLTEDNNAKQS